MTDAEKIAFKNRLKQWASQLIEQRIQSARVAISSAEDSANQEEQKSSVGDKYETTRARDQLEKDMYNRHLAENIKELAALLAIDTQMICPKVMAGAFVRGKEKSFFIAAGLGKQEIDGKTILFLDDLCVFSTHNSFFGGT